MLRFAVILLVLLSSLLLVWPTQAQGPLPPDQPPLVMVIVLDDSSTNWNPTGYNSARTADNARLDLRELTDPNRRRDEAVKNMVNLLASDQQAQHWVALLRFSANDAETDWLHATENQWVPVSENRGAQFTDANLLFIPLGGPDFDPANAPSYRAFLDLLQSREDPINAIGAGDVLLALTEAKTALFNRLTDDLIGYKPVVVLITDDVPIYNSWTTGPNPWFDSLRGDWKTRVEQDISGLVDLSLASQFNGNRFYSGPCVSPNSGIPVVTLALGAATWVNRDGIIREPQDTDAVIDDYYVDLVNNTGAVGLITQAPLYYRIDPRFESEDRLLGDLMTASTQAVRELRCLQQFDVSKRELNEGNKQVYEFKVSNLYRQIRLMVDIFDPEPSAPPEIRLPDGTSYTSAAPVPLNARVTRQQLSPNKRREIWTITRTADWAGTWQIRTSSTTTTTIQSEIILGLDDLQPGQAAAPIEDTSAESIELRVQLTTVDGLPINPQNDPLIGSASGTLDKASFKFERQADALVTRLSGDQIPSAGTYPLYVTITFDPALVSGPPKLLTIDNFMRITDEISLGPDIQPGNGALWQCTDIERGSQMIYGQRVSAYLYKSDDIEDEGLYSFVSVGVYLDDPITYNGLTPVPTPVERLLWDRQGNQGQFSGVVACQALTAHSPLSANTTPEPQPFYIYVIFQDGDSHGIPVKEWSYKLAPTLVPTSTPVPEIKPTPVPPPTPPPPNPGGQIEKLLKPWQPGWIMIAITMLLFAGLLLIRLWQALRGYLMPFSFIYLQRGERGAFLPILTAQERLFPFKRVKSIDNEAGELFKLICTPTQLYLRTDHYEAFVGRQRVRPGQTWPLQNAKNIILVDGKVFTVLDRRVSPDR